MFQVVEGRLSSKFNHFEQYYIEKIEATETRLMGVVALRIFWKSRRGDNAAYVQILHLDYSEYGIDDYFEYDFLHEGEKADGDRDEMDYHWKGFTDVMGGKIVSLPIDVCMKLIDSAILVWEDSELKKEGDDNLQFRLDSIARIDMMRQALVDSGELSHDYDSKFSSDECIYHVAEKNLSSYSVVNYFIMRLVDRDFEAAKYLSEMSIDELRQTEIVTSDVQTLIKNSIRKASAEDESNTINKYHCKSITMSQYSYFLSQSTLTLSGSQRDKDRKVIGFDFGIRTKLSAFETAILTKRTEYITVYDVTDELMNCFNFGGIPIIGKVRPKVCENGWRFTVYNKDNSHVDSKEYMLNGDVYCSALLTIPGEFIVMSYKLMDINIVEKSLVLWESFDQLTLKGRYEIRDSIFQTICEYTGSLFEDVIIHPEE